MTENTAEKLQDVAEDAKDKVSGNGHGDGSLAKRLLLPAAAGVGTVAATYAARKAPDLLREQLLSKLEEYGSDDVAKVGKQATEKLRGAGGIAGKAASDIAEKATGAGRK